MAHQVTLKWVASSDPVDGYNVYRGSDMKSLAKLNMSIVLDTQYVDKSPAFGVNYYSVRPVRSGVEAPDSNIVSKTIVPDPLSGVVIDS